MSIYDRRFGGPPSGASGAGNPSGAVGGAGSGGLGSGTFGGMGVGMGMGMTFPSQNLGSGNTAAALLSIHQQNANGPTTPLGSAQAQASAQQGRPDSSGPPLLLNNLAQHLNNPPTPGQGGQGMHGAHAQSPLAGMGHTHTGLGGIAVNVGGGGQSQGQGQNQQQQQQQDARALMHSPVGSINGGGAGGGYGYGGGGGAGGGAGSINMANMAGMASMAGLINAHALPGVGGIGGGGAQQPVKLLLLPGGVQHPAGSEEEKIYELITELLHPDTREAALLELSKKREMYEDLALVLWGGFGVMSSLLLEIVNVYPALSPPSLTAHASNRVCNALALLQCVASHQETRSLFLNAHIPLFLYPFLNTTSKTRPFEYLRLTSLGVIGALVKQNDNSDVINFLLSTEIIPLCLRIMETGSELSKTVAIFIVQKILLDDLGLQYICQTYERFYAVGAVLGNMVNTLVDTQAVRLLKHVVRCYLRMSDNPRAREALRACLPEALQNGSFNSALKGDQVTKRCLQTLLTNLNERSNE